MKGYDLHDTELKEITVGGEIQKIYHQFLKLAESKNKPLTLENVFIAGYMLANPILRIQLKQSIGKEIETNMRFN